MSEDDRGHGAPLRCDGSGLRTEQYLDVDDLLELAQEQAADDRVLYHVRQARSIAQARGETDE